MTWRWPTRRHDWWPGGDVRERSQNRDLQMFQATPQMRTSNVVREDNRDISLLPIELGRDDLEELHCFWTGSGWVTDAGSTVGTRRDSSVLPS
jgi:hypothetical protein